MMICNREDANVSDPPAAVLQGHYRGRDQDAVESQLQLCSTGNILIINRNIIIHRLNLRLCWPAFIVEENLQWFGLVIFTLVDVRFPPQLS